MLKVIVKESRWYRGHGSTVSKLRLADGRQCCLGFACRASGLSADEIAHCIMPNDLPYGKVPAWAEANAVLGLAIANDLRAITDAERKRRITKLGRTIGLDFKFVP